MSKPSIPQGTRDFSAAVVRKRNYIFNTIKAVFELYGFEPLETPAMENLETLMGKYGDEGDKLIFKILNNGLDNQDKIQKTQEGFAKIIEGKSSKEITERALRYDLTIPFARYVAMNHGQLTFPFKRYQIQPVWRADRPQRGRYREFYQCDADIVGSKTLLNEVELVNIYATVFSKLGIDVEIRINSRKILAGIAEVIDESERMIDITVAIDKIDKIGVDGVKNELIKQGFAEEKVKLLYDFILLQGKRIMYGDGAVKENYNLTILNFLKNGSDYRKSDILQEGVKELEYIINYCRDFTNIKVDFTLARGLNYYTGIIFEIKANNVQMGSIGGGGRYDDLTGLFGVPNIPGVGISFGVDRIYDVMEELKLFPTEVESTTTTKILFFNLGEAESKKAYAIMQQLRDKNIGCELYHEQTKFDKQFKYAEKKGINHIAILGSKELEEGSFNLKNLSTGSQSSIAFNSFDEIINSINS